MSTSLPSLGPSYSSVYAPSVGTNYTNPFGLSDSMSSGLGAILGGAAGLFPTTGNQTTTGTMHGTSSGSYSPNLSPTAQSLLNNLVNQYSTLASQGPNLSDYEAAQGNAINKTYNAAQQKTQQEMAARGLATSPVSGSVQSSQDMARASAMGQLHQSIPLLQQQLQLQDLAPLMQLFQSIPYGYSTSGTQDQSTQQTTKTASGGGIGSLIGGALSGLAMFSDKRIKENIKYMKEIKLKPVTFNYKGDDTKIKGYIAQDVKKEIPEAVGKLGGLHFIDFSKILPHEVK
jgi:hypothetical protein